MENILYVVTYGRLENNEIKTVVVSGLEETKRMAAEFIQVIPDDLAWYKNKIGSWKGKSALVITHQDDDTFYFSATEGPTSDAQFPVEDQDMKSFTKFVSDFYHED